MGKQVFGRETQILPRLNITDKHSSSYQLDLVCTKYRKNEKKPLKQAKYPNKTTETKNRKYTWADGHDTWKVEIIVNDIK